MVTDCKIWYLIKYVNKILKQIMYFKSFGCYRSNIINNIGVKVIILQF